MDNTMRDRLLVFAVFFLAALVFVGAVGEVVVTGEAWWTKFLKPRTSGGTSGGTSGSTACKDYCLPNNCAGIQTQTPYNTCKSGNLYKVTYTPYCATINRALTINPPTSECQKVCSQKPTETLVETCKNGCVSGACLPEGPCAGQYDGLSPMSKANTIKYLSYTNMKAMGFGAESLYNQCYIYKATIAAFLVAPQADYDKTVRLTEEYCAEFPATLPAEVTAFEASCP